MELIATDLDGTLLGPGSVLSARTVAALDLARRSGVHVVAATGRGWRSASHVLADTAVIEHAICSNGALHFDRPADRIVRTDPIDRAAVAVAGGIVVGNIDDVGLGWELADGSFAWDERFMAHNPVLAERRSNEKVDRLPVDDPPGEVLKLLVSCPTYGEDELFEVLHPLMPDDVETTASGIAFVEITGKGVHKAKALASLCADLSIDRADVVAFGDNRNDLAMIEWAGTGYAMANANPALLDVADVEAPHHAEDGVAQVIESLLV